MGISIDSGINIFKNMVQINTTNQDSTKSLIAQRGVLIPDEVTISSVSELIKPAVDIYAGLNIYCTSGFSVKNSSGTKGISTAAHCPNGSASYGGTSLPFVAESYVGSNDVEWHTTPGLTVRNWYSAGGTAYLVNSTTTRSNQVLNSYICKSGIVTGYACGYITDKNVNPGYIPGGGSATFIRLHKTAANLAQSGDSGGPVFSGNSAYGIISGSQSQPPLAYDAIYMAVDYFSSINVTICTTDPC